MYFLVFITIVALSVWCFRTRKQKEYKLPAGPRGIPIFGNIHQLMTQNPFHKLSEWADKFGKIYTINICTKQAVVINDPKLMRDILNTFESTAKFKTDTIVLMSQGPYGIVNSDGEQWSLQRTFCLKNLKQFGFGNKRMDTLILSEANEVCNWIAQKNQTNNQKPIHIQHILVQSVVNTIWTMISGKRITLGDSKITNLFDIWSETFQHTMKTGLTFLPWLKYLAPKLSGYTAYNKACLDMLQYIETEFVEHKKSFSAGTHRNLIDAYIEESSQDPLKWKNAVATVVEMFIGGSESTASSITWILFYLSVNPEIQTKLQEEIDGVVGENGEISVDHKSCMPYTAAVIQEGMRMASITPMGVPHQLLADLEIEGYKLSKGLILIPNMYHCHHNKDVWNDPEVFRPQRFLDEQGGKLKEHVIPFQPGKRQCVGEPLAKDMLFIFVTRIFQLFDVKPDINEDPNDYYKPNIGFGHFPPRLGLYITPRYE